LAEKTVRKKEKKVGISKHKGVKACVIRLKSTWKSKKEIAKKTRKIANAKAARALKIKDIRRR
jgi:hypothetical protein